MVGIHFAFETSFHCLETGSYCAQLRFVKYSISSNYFLVLLEIVFAKAESFDNSGVYFI